MAHAPSPHQAVLQRARPVGGRRGGPGEALGPGGGRERRGGRDRGGGSSPHPALFPRSARAWTAFASHPRR
jgi:hypothetical protein